MALRVCATTFLAETTVCLNGMRYDAQSFETHVNSFPKPSKLFVAEDQGTRNVRGELLVHQILDLVRMHENDHIDFVQLCLLLPLKLLNGCLAGGKGKLNALQLLFQRLLLLLHLLAALCDVRNNVLLVEPLLPQCTYLHGRPRLHFLMADFLLSCQL